MFNKAWDMHNGKEVGKNNLNIKTLEYGQNRGEREVKRERRKMGEEKI